MQKHLWSEADLTLNRAIELTCSIKAEEMQTSQLKNTTSSAPVMKLMQMSQATRIPEIPDKQGKCTCCGGGNHKAKDCRHRNSKCYKYHKTGHLSSVCRLTKASNVTNLSRPSTHYAKWVDETPQQPNIDSNSTIFNYLVNLKIRSQWNT